MRRAGFGLAILSAVPLAHAQYIGDGDLDTLPVGTAPDTWNAAGRWRFGQFFREQQPDEVQIVLTNTFSAGSSGNSLALNSPETTVYATMVQNQFLQQVQHVPGRRTVVEFRIWVPEGPHSGGYIAIGRGDGTMSDRGPQLRWLSDGTIAAYIEDPNSSVPFTQVLSTGFLRGDWQRVRLEVDLGSRLYDVDIAQGSGPWQRVGSGLGFRSTSVGYFEAFFVARFSDSAASARCYIDDLSLLLLSSGTCYPNCDDSTAPPRLNIADFTCFLGRFAAGDPYANCDESTTPPTLNVSDFTCFLLRFSGGCP